MFEELFSESGFSLDRCRAFLAITEAGGITQAAAGSASRQSQLSRQLGELESWLGARLMVRGRGRFALTDTGKQLSSILKTSFSEMVRLKAYATEGLQTVRIGAGESLLQWVVLPALVRTERAGLLMEWQLKNLRSEDIISELLDGGLDFGLIRRMDVPAGLRSKTVVTMKYVLCVPKQFVPLLKDAKSTMRPPLATLEGASHLDEFAVNLKGAVAKRWERRFICTSLSQVAEAVRLGAAAAILPEQIVHLAADAAAALFPIKAGKADGVTLMLLWNPIAQHTWKGFETCRTSLEQALAKSLSAGQYEMH
jgi:DNA-binding transcriptional LysR family regulator